METYLLDETEVRERPAKKLKRFNTITSIFDTCLITSRVITGGISITAFASGVIGLPVGIAFIETSILFSFGATVTQKSFKMFVGMQ